MHDTLHSILCSTLSILDSHWFYGALYLIVFNFGHLNNVPNEEAEYLISSILLETSLENKTMYNFAG